MPNITPERRRDTFTSPESVEQSERVSQTREPPSRAPNAGLEASRNKLARRTAQAFKHIQRKADAALRLTAMRKYVERPRIAVVAQFAYVLMRENSFGINPAEHYPARNKARRYKQQKG